MGAVKVHLDTDFAGDTDDAAALAMLLGWPDVELVGITTVADPDGRRAGYVMRMLEIAHRDDIPVAAGAGASLSGAAMGGLPDHDAYWGGAAVTPVRAPRDASTELMRAGIEAGAIVIGIGPFTNLARLEAAHPGALATTQVTLMGGWIDRASPSLPQWGPDMDWNTQCDTAAAQQVFAAAGDLLLATLPGTLRGQLRLGDLARLDASGPLGRLLARQARAYAVENDTQEWGRGYDDVADDLCNFQYDPVACATAVGWPGATVETTSLLPTLDGNVLRYIRADDGKPVRALVDIDGPAFTETWLRAVERADTP
jgi:inosine-uridine nucleoside N-ribohydrolase